MRTSLKVTFLGAASLGFSLLAGCLNGAGVIDSSATNPSQTAIVITPALPPAPTGPIVCDPLGTPSGGVNSDLQHGLIASLYYAPGENSATGDGACPFSDPNECNGVLAFQAACTEVNATLFFSQLNVPTRKFNLGFVTTDGSAIETPQGNTLYEWFSLHFDSVLKLGPNDQPGLYQFAVLSDDGSIISIDQGSGFQPLINNDGVHPSLLGCAKQAVAMTQSSAIPLKVDYYQGPRYEIALILLYRRVQPGQSLSDPACGMEGNETFFNDTVVPSAPTSVWSGLLSRGWSVVPASDFYLPQQAPSNPCNVPCFTDSFTQPADDSGGCSSSAEDPTEFLLTHTGVDPSTIQAVVNGINESSSYNSSSDQVDVPSAGDPGSIVNISYCLQPEPVPSPSGGPIPTPSSSPIPISSPTPAPSAAPSPTPSPSGTPCVGFGCGGGSIGD